MPYASRDGKDRRHRRYHPRQRPDAEALQEMLALGVFEGKYCNDCRGELPDSWFEGAKIAAVADRSLNCFG